MAEKIELGCTVRDRISGFQGVVTARTEYLTGCDRLCVAARELDKDGKVRDQYWFDEITVERVGDGVLAFDAPSRDAKPGGGSNPTPRADAPR